VKRSTAAIGTVLLACALATGCASTEEDPGAVRVAALKGPTTMGLVGLMDADASGTSDLDYEVTVYGTPDEVVPKIVQGDLDIALIPANLAAVLYNRTAGTDAAIEVLAVNTLGVLSVVESGTTVDGIEDLAGRTIYSTGKGSSPEFVLNYLLAENGLEAGVDVTVQYMSEATEVAAALSAEPGAVGVLPQPYVTVLTSKNPGIRVALDLTDEWEKVATDSQLVTGVVIVRTAFSTVHPEALDRFLAEYRSSTEFVNASPAEAAPLIVDAGIVPDAALAEAAIPFCHITFLAGSEMRSSLEGYLTVLFAADPASVGGSLPDDAFYHNG
jgi:NitT/TauT family transport system substrate-binding protein